MLPSKPIMAGKSAAVAMLQPSSKAFDGLVATVYFAATFGDNGCSGKAITIGAIPARYTERRTKLTPARHHRKHRNLEKQRPTLPLTAGENVPSN